MIGEILWEQGNNKHSLKGNSKKKIGVIANGVYFWSLVQQLDVISILDVISMNSF